MPIQLDAVSLRKIFPRAPQTVIDAFVARQHVLDAAGITHTRKRLAFAFSQVEHECGGYTIPHLTENVRYSAERAAEIWPKRFPPVVAGRGDPATVRAKYGTDPGWQLKMFDDVYGNRMGNRRGTRDGSTYIGRAGPQITGLDAYRVIGRMIGVPLSTTPQLATRHESQPDILAAFWTWKGLNRFADVGDFRGCTKAWNGGHIGQADREAKLAGNDPVIARMAIVERLAPEAEALPGGPPTPEPPAEAIDNATVNERRSRKGGVAGAGAGAGNEIGNASTVQPDKPAGAFLPSWAATSLVVAGVIVFVVATVLIARKRAAVKANWR